MMTQSAWHSVEPTIDAALDRFDFPLEELASGNVPAIIARNAWSVEACDQLVARLLSEGLIYDPNKPVPEKFLAEAIPEGHFRKGNESVPSRAWKGGEKQGRIRIDIGTSLGYRGDDQDDFLAHSFETHELFNRLFAKSNNPIRVLYDSLQSLSRGKTVVTAYEPDGREYGPAIIRAHYGGYEYKPHFDSVRFRENRTDYAVYRFDHQFAGVLVLQNTQLDDQSAQSRLHRCFWSPEVEPHLKNGTFHEYADEQQIDRVDVVLQPGDLYFFNTRMIHEVPGVAGRLPRIVVAVFIGFSFDSDEIFVWS